MPDGRLVPGSLKGSVPSKSTTESRGSKISALLRWGLKVEHDG